MQAHSDDDGLMFDPLSRQYIPAVPVRAAPTMGALEDTVARIIADAHGHNIGGSIGIRMQYLTLARKIIAEVVRASNVASPAVPPR